MPKAKIIAEISGNHAGSLANAHKLVQAAKDAGADYVKFQAFTLDEMCPVSSDPAYVMQSGPWEGMNLRALYANTRTPLGWLPDLFRHARDSGIEPFASVFGLESLEAVGMLAPRLYKVASAEAVDLAFVHLVQSFGTTLVSLGCRTDPIPGTVSMWCVAEYPARSAHLGVNLPNPWGFSDHTTGYRAAQLAVARGAQYLEKHLMLPGVACEDEAFSLSPEEFGHYVISVREAEAHLTYRPAPEYGFVRRWVAARNLQPGPLSAADVRTARASSGIIADQRITRLLVPKQAGQPILVGEAV